jgi:hypothetical protein
MVKANRTGSSPGDSGASSRPYQADRISRGSSPAYNDESRTSHDWEDHDERSRSRSSSFRDDYIPLLGILIGGVVGYLAASAISGAQTRPERASFDRYSRRGHGASSSSSVERDETTDLIASNKVEGTAVYNRQDEKLGSVYNFMVGKRSGQVAYAVMSFGGFLGLGQSYHALPWSVLTYDTDRGGYVIDADKDRLMSAPSYEAGEEPFSQPDYMRRVQEYWSSGKLSL